MIWLILSLLLAGASLLVLRAMKQGAPRRPISVVVPPPGGSRGVVSAEGPRFWGQQLLVPDPKRACEAAQALRNQSFENGKVPELPLAACNKARCACELRPLPDRRSHYERRMGMDRRELIRYAFNPDRRLGFDRRRIVHNQWAGVS